MGLISIYVTENNGIRFLASSLRQAGFRAVEIYLKDYQHHCYTPPTERELQLLVDTLAQSKVSAVGISLRAGGYLKLAAQLTTLIKQQLQVPVIWGGMHVTMAPEECLQYTDILAVGECEQVVCEFMQAVSQQQSMADIANLWLRLPSGQIVRNAPRPLQQDLDSLPFRDFHTHQDKYWIDNDRVKRGDPYVNQTIFLMMSARGCLFNCSFCDISALRKAYHGLGNFYRTMSPARIVEECLYAKQNFPRLRRFRFDDELFCMRKEWVAEFAHLYKQQVDMPFELLTDPRVVDSENMQLLKWAGLDTVMMGIQNVSRVNQALYNRSATDESVRQAAQVLHKLRLNPCYQILLDDPHLCEADKRELFDFLTTLPRPYDLYLFSLSYWPQTDTTDKYLQDGTISLDDIEGRNDKCLKQFRVDLSWPRSNEDVFWDSLYTLLSKPVVPLSLVIKLSHCNWLKRHPHLLRVFAQLLNTAKLAYLAGRMLLRGELTIETVKRWVNWKSLATA